MSSAVPTAFHRVFSSHMVLQRGKPIIFSGTAGKARKLTLTFAGQTRTFAADAEGEWQAEFPPMAAGVCGDAVLSDGTAEVTLSDLLIGDVWFCSGQSNMEMPVWCEEAFFHDIDPESLLADADIPNLRLINVNADTKATRTVSADGPLAETTAPGWCRSSRESVRDFFSSLAFQFGRQLHRETGVPVGLINANWGATKIQAWISREKFERENYRPVLDIFEGKCHQKRATMAELHRWLKEDFHGYGRTVAPADFGEWANPDYDDSSWPLCRLPFAIPLPGVHGLRFTLDLPASFEGQELTVELGTVNDVDTTSFNGEKIGETGVDVPGYWYAQRVYSVPARLVKTGRNILYVQMENHFSSGSVILAERHGRIYPSGRPELALPLDKIIRHAKAFDAPPQIIGYRPTVDYAEDNGPATPNYPANLFNGVAAPFFKLAVKGVIWYQGCGNAGDEAYYRLHQMLIEDWRAHWHDPELPFLLVQLAGFEAHTPETPLEADYWKAYPPLPEYPYAFTREIQAEMPHLLANVGMAVAMDAGEASDIHPHDKSKVAFRLVREAERIAYGMPVASQGPEFHHFEVEEGGVVRIYFTHAQNGLKTCDGKAPGAWTLIDRDGRSIWCEGKIEGSTVVVSSPGIPHPAAVRYAYCQHRGDVNLMNEEGFPCVPFRSDKRQF